MNNDARAKVVAKIRALLAKTAENGCSESEALAAAQKASELMEEYELTHADVESVKEERFGKRARPFGSWSGSKRHFHEVDSCRSAIARFCNCICWTHGIDLIYFGSETDTEIAHGLTDILRHAIDREWNAYLKSALRPSGVHGKSLRGSFMYGIVTRLIERLDELKKQREGNLNATEKGRALVIVKDQIVKQRFQALGIKLKSRGRTYTSRSDAALAAGRAAGDRINITTGVGGSRSAGAIGGR